MNYIYIDYEFIQIVQVLQDITNKFSYVAADLALKCVRAKVSKRLHPVHSVDFSQLQIKMYHSLFFIFYHSFYINSST